MAKLSQEVDQLKLHLEQEMTSVQSQLKPYIEEQVERLKKDVALYAEVTALHCGHSNCVKV